MSDAGPDSLSTLEEALEVEQDIHDEKTALDDLEDTLDELDEETRSTLNNLDEEEQKMVREAFDRSLGDFFENLVAGSASFKPGEFEDDLEDFVADFRSVLHHPEAEKTVEDIEDWLVNAGTGPLDEDVREELIEVVEQDVDRVNSAIDTAKTALQSINADGTVHTSVARLVKGELADVSSVDKIDNIADDLEDIAGRWPYPWNSDLPEPLGSDVRTRIDDLLFDRIQSIVDDANAFEQFTTLARERVLEAEKTLSDAENVVSKLHERYELLTEVSVGSPTDTGQDELENKLRAAETVNDVVTGCREVLSIFDVMNDVATESVRRFGVPDNSTESLDFIRTSLSRIDTKHRDLLTTRDRILSGDIEDYDEAQEGFSELIEKAEQELKGLRNRIEHEIQTGKELAEIFGINEKAQSLNEVELAVSRAETVEDLVQQARECRTIRTEITDIITEDHLDPTQASVFEFILDGEANKGTNSDVIKSISGELEMDQTEVLGVIHDLKDEGLVSISIEGA
ncbi:hypothetical protein [Natrialbaceae archaeon AArc-T1-2]|uniref:hypothetical protein n=1 Tax=Natrialbaceae archaeon AArc-T1-2 TaxID=3053904 RepID=UPI00255AC28B|nr:hypothetical protein [Natrialbaceae archaeon AArc-T1-2]WIV68895.1 hypothetical protein QQ977_17100 [Natrialbaceae archaeon AArc-T1-2]